MTFSGFFDSVLGSVASGNSAISLNTSDKLPSYLATTDGTVPRGFQEPNWHVPPTQGPYQFAVESVDISEGGLNPVGKFVASVTSLFGTGGQFTEFNLPITPQEITQTEDFAVSVKPTQGGTVIQHSGNRYKTLVISGTTGVAPFKGNLGANSNSGLANGQPDELKYRSGYEVFQHFRNWMKSYHEAKSLGDSRKKLRMIFRNFKDWEFLYVEPIKFTMKRDAQKPLLYNYTIQLRVIGHVSPEKPLFPFLDSIDNVLNKAAKAINVGTALVRKTQNLIVATVGNVQDTLDTVRRVSSAITTAQRASLNFKDLDRKILKNNLSKRDSITLINRIGDVAENIAKDTRTYEAQGVLVETLPEDLDDFSKSIKNQAAQDPDNAQDIAIQALDDLGDGTDTLNVEDSLPEAGLDAALEQALKDALISREALEALQDQINSLEVKYNNSIGLGSDEFNSIYDVTEELTDQNITGDVSDDAFQASYGLQQIKLGVGYLLSNDQLFDENAELINQQNANNGSQTVGQGIFSFPDKDAGTKEGIVPTGASLEDIALAELGDASRWTELAELNGLKTPYIQDAPDSDYAVTYTPQYQTFSDPSDIQDLTFGYSFLIPQTPTPVGAWAGKSNYIAEYTGGLQTSADSWRFIFPQDGAVAEIQETGEVVQYSGVSGTWADLDLTQLQQQDVLRPGDVILIPTSDVPPPRTRIRGPRDNIVTNDLDNSQKALAVDLRLTADGDLDLQPDGDLGLSLGTTNGIQAIALKLLYNKGSLKKFPSIGTSIGVGQKMPDLAEIRQEVFSSLVQDDRIETVSEILVERNNGTLELSFNVKFVELQDPVPVSIPI